MNAPPLPADVGTQWVIYLQAVPAGQCDGGPGACVQGGAAKFVNITITRPAPPVVTPSAIAYSGIEGQPIDLGSWATTDPGGGSITSYQWTYGTVSGSGSCGLTSTAAASAYLNCDEGDYNVTLTAVDSYGLQASATVPVTVHDSTPTVSDLSLAPVPAPTGTTVVASASLSDQGAAVDTYTATWNWGDGSSTVSAVVPGALSASHEYAAPGVYPVTLTATDDAGTSTTASDGYAVAYDPSAGFVTGGGWIQSPAGAYTPDPALTGKAEFGFVSKYQQGATVPSGHTQFVLQAGGVHFASTGYQWLVVNQDGTNAQFKGTGTINATGSYTFMVWAAGATSTSPATFRIQITDNVTGAVVYDNGVGQAIGGGAILVHT